MATAFSVLATTYAVAASPKSQAGACQSAGRNAGKNTSSPRISNGLPLANACARPEWSSSSVKIAGVVWSIAWIRW